MSTSAQIRTAWDAVLSHATVQAMTTNTFFYIPSEQLSSEVLDSLMFGQEIHFITCICTRSESERGATNGVWEYTHTVQLSYFLETNVDGTNFNTVIDNMQTIDGLVKSELDYNWSDTVDYYNLVQESPIPEIVTIDKKQVYTQTFSYEAINRETI